MFLLIGPSWRCCKPQRADNCSRGGKSLGVQLEADALLTTLPAVGDVFRANEHIHRPDTEVGRCPAASLPDRSKGMTVQRDSKLEAAVQSVLIADFAPQDESEAHEPLQSVIVAPSLSFIDAESFVINTRLNSRVLEKSPQGTQDGLSRNLVPDRQFLGGIFRPSQKGWYFES